MKNLFLCLFALAAGASAFSLSPSVSRRPHIDRTTLLFNSAEPTQEEQAEDGMDLNLEEMFTMFDAADKEQDFDKAIKSVKKEQ
jgi:hypothetical protein